MDEAPKSYRERQREARRAASALKRAREAEWQRLIALDAECRRLAKQAVRDQIRARGQKITDYSVREINLRAEALAPQFVELAKVRVEQLTFTCVGEFVMRNPSPSHRHQSVRTEALRQLLAWSVIVVSILSAAMLVWIATTAFKWLAGFFNNGAVLNHLRRRA
jgi:hypothetical protein